MMGYLVFLSLLSLVLSVGAFNSLPPRTFTNVGRAGRWSTQWAGEKGQGLFALEEQVAEDVAAGSTPPQDSKKFALSDWLTRTLQRQVDELVKNEGQDKGGSSEEEREEARRLAKELELDMASLSSELAIARERAAANRAAKEQTEKAGRKWWQRKKKTPKPLNYSFTFSMDQSVPVTDPDSLFSYLAIPAKEYSVLDGQMIRRLGDDRFLLRVPVGEVLGINFCPSLEVAVSVDPVEHKISFSSAGSTLYGEQTPPNHSVNSTTTATMDSATGPLDMGLRALLQREPAPATPPAPPSLHEWLQVSFDASLVGKPYLESAEEESADTTDIGAVAMKVLEKYEGRMQPTQQAVVTSSTDDDDDDDDEADRDGDGDVLEEKDAGRLSCHAEIDFKYSLPGGKMAFMYSMPFVQDKIKEAVELLANFVMKLFLDLLVNDYNCYLEKTGRWRPDYVVGGGGEKDEESSTMMSSLPSPSSSPSLVGVGRSGAGGGGRSMFGRRRISDDEALEMLRSAADESGSE